MAEGYVYAVLSAFDGHPVEGQAYFNTPAPVLLPVFEKIERHGGIVKGGVPFELDLWAEWPLPDQGGGGAWLVQVRYTKRPMGLDAVKQFLSQTETIIHQQDYASIQRWYFCKQGYTKEAIAHLKQTGVFFSDRLQFNALANLFNFFGLPK